MNPKIISIIGGRGKMGSLFAEAFKSEGYEVLVSGEEDSDRNIELAQKGDVVIISVPIRDTKAVIEQIGPHVRENALLTDFTSVKIMPSNAMLENSKAEIISGHPVFGPSAGFSGNNFILCPVRGDSYLSWFENFLSFLGCKILKMSPEDHDKHMGVIQCLTHFSSVALAETLRKLEVDLKKSEELSSPIYLLRLYCSGRVISQDPELYADIQIDNPYSKEVAKAHAEVVEELRRCILDSDKPSYEKAFSDAKEYFGDVGSRATKITSEVIRYIAEKDKK